MRWPGLSLLKRDILWAVWLVGLLSAFGGIEGAQASPEQRAQQAYSEGYVLFQKGRYRQAAPYFLRAFKSAPRRGKWRRFRAAMLFFRGICAYRMGEWRGARRLLRRYQRSGLGKPKLLSQARRALRKIRRRLLRLRRRRPVGTYRPPPARTQKTTGTTSRPPPPRRMDSPEKRGPASGPEAPSISPSNNLSPRRRQSPTSAPGPGAPSVSPRPEPGPRKTSPTPRKTTRHPSRRTSGRGSPGRRGTPPLRRVAHLPSRPTKPPAPGGSHAVSYVFLGAGLVSLGVGVVTGILALTNDSKSHDIFEQAPRDALPSAREVMIPKYEAETYALTSYITMAAGGAFAATGLILLLATR